MCKLAHYGNCDEETKDDEYCIFHKPNKTDEEAKKFYEMLILKYKPETEETYDDVIGFFDRFIFDGNINFSGFVFPEIPEDCNFTFREIEFRGDVKFDDAVFEFTPEFNNSQFDFASFNGTQFKKGADFTHSHFKKSVWFRNTKFYDITVLGLSTFEEMVFAENIYFDTHCFSFSTFKKGVDFKGISGKRIELIRTKFYGPALFSIDSVKDMRLDGATFEDSLLFVPFGSGGEIGEISFNFTQFNKDLSLEFVLEKIENLVSRAEACRVQRKIYEREDGRDLADDLFRKGVSCNPT
ncbi:pentapeptide repeat-containing protein [Candidatus Aciduliprofundum boonei]|uniref:Pentapeptide repeat protein n=1 Tax=Aciduliprofundum boonei (strain DSM 19572 / T469) TaxID=439481 RepID=B5IFQ8_ACIB4|nr:pentapeptide repeat-containing protein [Candidatus Aciduliprofundum boonei]ADD08990.1 hypothetical protein Aboo_1181 [Aciduliprofundum boonei T469]EDY34943.1 hypothetical protein ABOONEI_1209 [Aciduliprofundum boonei T469]HII55180.1 pentapeptide repeat-containing protein [Candidatus Aciduliprofundum boonei]